MCYTRGGKGSFVEACHRTQVAWHLRILRMNDVLPRMGTKWAQSREQLSGQGTQPAPWMWQEARVLLHNKVFVDDGDAIFVN